MFRPLRLSNETLHLDLGGQLSEACENFDRSGTTELYVASSPKGDGAVLLVSDPNGRQCAQHLIALPGNSLCRSFSTPSAK
jgi:hypothetical protein